MAKVPAEQLADNLLVQELENLSTRSARLRRLLETGATDEEREIARVLVRAGLFMHQPPDRGYAEATTFAVGEWLEQARRRELGADWLRAACVAHDQRFARVPLARYASALKLGSGRPSKQMAAARLVKAAGISTAEAESLASGARRTKAKRR